MKTMQRLLATVLGLFYIGLAWAQGGIVENLLDFEETVHDLVKGVCVMTGVGLLAGSLLRYQQYRRGEQGIKFHQVVWLAIFGLIMVGIGYLPGIQF